VTSSPNPIRSLQEFFSSIPEFARRSRENPNAFMRQEHASTGVSIAVNSSGRDLEDFGQFLGGTGKSPHALEDPKLANNQQFIEASRTPAVPDRTPE